MFSRPDHHHQSGPAACPAGPSLPTPPYSSVGARDHLIDHHRHLETLLDSTLATLTLIHAESAAGGHCLLPYSPHLLGVFNLISHHIISPIPTTPSTPVPTTTHTEATAPLAPTSYTAATRVMSPTPPETNMAKQPTAKPRAPIVEKPPRIIIRFDREPAHLSRPQRPSPATLYSAITNALLPLLDDTTNTRSCLAGVQWTKSGNLALHPATDVCTAKFLASHSYTIWSTIRPLLGLPDDRESPAFDTDERWHSVVFHGVPMPAPKTDAPKVFTRELVDEWVTSPSSQGSLREYSVMCRPDDLEHRKSLTLRLSFSSEADAERLIRTGGYMFGVPCRVSRYVPRPRSRSSTPPQS
ncbi:hypothetical protein MVEN_01307800 [Mycena venus]|uniref:Uncharacterized protein n=1 Tax=Mycena venus TaxID=2733690 RepID=A0A8H6Y139_9AGAR|nr:hypothetical protein MVEN_01307800 [Mycena venus]